MHMSDEESDRFPTDRTFGVAAWKLPVNIAWERGKESAELYLPLSEARSAEVCLTDESDWNSIKDTMWIVSHSTLWPSAEESLTFLAYSPFSAACSCDTQNGVKYTADILKEQVDLLYTQPITDRHKVNHGWVVPAKFQHAFCQIEFAAKHRVSRNEKIIVRRISIDNVCRQGTFTSLPEPRWSYGNLSASIEFFNGAKEITGTISDIGKKWFIIPHYLNTKVTVEYDYTTPGGNIISHKLQTKHVQAMLEPGKKYTYTLSIGIDDVMFLEEIAD